MNMQSTATESMGSVLCIKTMRIIHRALGQAAIGFQLINNAELFAAERPGMFLAKLPSTPTVSVFFDRRWCFKIFPVWPPGAPRSEMDRKRFYLFILNSFIRYVSRPCLKTRILNATFGSNGIL